MDLCELVKNEKELSELSDILDKVLIKYNQCVSPEDFVVNTEHYTIKGVVSEILRLQSELLLSEENLKDGHLRLETAFLNIRAKEKQLKGSFERLSDSLFNVRDIQEKVKESIDFNREERREIDILSSQLSSMRNRVDKKLDDLIAREKKIIEVEQNQQTTRAFLVGAEKDHNKKLAFIKSEEDRIKYQNDNLLTLMKGFKKERQKIDKDKKDVKDQYKNIELQRADIATAWEKIEAEVKKRRLKKQGIMP